MTESPELYGPNAGYVAELYERYLTDPTSVDAEARSLFASGYRPSLPVETSKATGTTPSSVDVDKVIHAGRLARLVRELGHRAASLDPLGSEPPGDVELTLAHHDLTEADLAALPASVVGGPLAEGSKNALDAYKKLKEAYSGSVGYEDDHIQSSEERAWLRGAVETRKFFQTVTDDDRKWLLKRLTKVDTFEQFLQKTAPFQGQKRFSIEGLDILVPMLDAIVRDAANAGTNEVAIGMAHRGRLSVLAHTLGKPYEVMLSEFPVDQKAAEALPSVSGGGSHGYTGDVKYHKGWVRSAEEAGHSVRVSLAPNPSHLEFVNPVVVGGARAGQESRGAGAPIQTPAVSLPILIHGDAAFPGQGVVAETLNMANLKGYRVGGTVHIIANNQVGFTTDPHDARSTLYASDLAKGFEIPIVHVNGDDPEACLAVARMAIAYRTTFGKDFLIDVVGYRRWGHNETDEPRYTQPGMYNRIDAHPRLREKWAATLAERGLVTKAEADGFVEEIRAKLMAAREAARTQKKHLPDTEISTKAKAPKTAVTAERLSALNERLNAFPSGFAVNAKLEKTYLEPRRTALDSAEPKIQWAHAEMLAYGSLLEDGVPVRLSGQDVERGTFSQRMLVLHDTVMGKEHCALQSLSSANASLALHNSPLSETAVLGFEYGYAVRAPEALVIWEAQFGDFSNGAQVIIDQFLASGGVKWSQHVGLTMLLPHGYEGMGPEHSSARLERFLQLGAGDNIQVCNCSSAAQYFHLLRRQAARLQTDPRPLIVMTPKYLLRHPRACATLAELSEGAFQPVLDDPRPASRKSEVSRLVLCSGKVYVDLVFDSMPPYNFKPEYEKNASVAVGRVEQLFPFPAEEVQKLLSSYPNLTEVVWLQEEPKNMGAWSFVASRLYALLPDGVTLRYEGRPEEASPAEGSVTAHNAEQQRLLSAALSHIVPPPHKNGNGKHKNGAGARLPVNEPAKSSRTEER